MINPKNSHKDLNGVLKINFTMLEKYIKILPIKYARKFITLQQGNNHGLVNQIDKYHSHQHPLSKEQLLCICNFLLLQRKIQQIKIV